MMKREASTEIIHFDDLAVGQVYSLGSCSLSEDDIIGFATRYDPQPFHVDPKAAAGSIYGGVIASGWQTVCMFTRLLVDELLVRSTSMGSPGMDELRWPKPVRPGDRLDARVEVLELRPSRSRPDRGLARLRCVMVDADEEEVLTFVANILFRKRKTG